MSGQTYAELQEKLPEPYLKGLGLNEDPPKPRDTEDYGSEHANNAPDPRQQVLPFDR
tara:strand:- start:274 stop:444 length:171 start_codon:yes stop_codon:yes gene_type:complete